MRSIKSLDKIIEILKGKERENSRAQMDRQFLLQKGASDMNDAFCTADPHEKVQSPGKKT